MEIAFDDFIFLSVEKTSKIKLKVTRFTLGSTDKFSPIKAIGSRERIL